MSLKIYHKMKFLSLIRRYPFSRTFRGYCKSEDSPVKFTSSNASSWKAEYSRIGISQEDESAWFQPYAVTLSFAVFLIYFCILREENDIDELLGSSVFDKVDGLEEVSLRRALEYNIDHGIDSNKIILRLKEIELGKKNKGL